MFRLFNKPEPKPKPIPETERIPPKDIFLEYPLGVRSVLLMHYKHRSKNFNFMKDELPYQKESDRLQKIIIERNDKGQEFEQQGKFEKAIDLYEKNIADFADTPFPYDRLRIIYTKLKRYDDAIRACQAYIEMSKCLEKATLEKLGDQELAKTLGQIGDYPEWIKKLEQKNNK